MSALRTLKNHQLRLNGTGRYGRKRAPKYAPFSSVFIAPGADPFAWGHLRMLHTTKGPRQRNMSDKLFNLIVLSARGENDLEKTIAAANKIREYWGFIMENARTIAQPRRYPLV